MKGVVFIELMDLVEDKFGHKVLQNTIKGAKLTHDGVYVGGGYYPFEELQRIVVSLSKETGLPIPKLLTVYGQHLFSVLITSYPQLATGKKNTIEFLSSIDNYIHVEVRKLYPDAELPRFKIEDQKEKSIVMIYESPRRLEDLGHGLILGCADFYKEKVTVDITPLPEINEHSVKYVVTLSDQPYEADKSQKQDEKPKGFWGFIKSLFS